MGYQCVDIATYFNGSAEVEHESECIIEFCWDSDEWVLASDVGSIYQGR
jgi:hypothetical protein